MHGILNLINLKINELFQQKRSQQLADIYVNWLAKGDKVLDVGCGDGIVSYKLKTDLKLNLTGCDIHNYLLRDIPFRLMSDISRIPFADKTFDAVIFNDVLHHTSRENQIILIQEALRVAKKTVIIDEMLPTVITLVGDLLLNKLTHPTMEVPLTLRSARDWMKILVKLPVKIRKYNLPKRINILPHVIFVLSHKRSIKM